MKLFSAFSSGLLLAATLCAQDEIFNDDFEEGHLAGWSAVVIPFQVEIFEPEDGLSTQDATVDVVGRVSGSSVGEVKINDKPAVVTRGTFTLRGLLLVEGENRVVATATNGAQQRSATVTVRRDTTPPQVTIASSLDQTATSADTIEITGTVSEPATVSVGDQQIEVLDCDAEAERCAFSLAEVKLSEGNNDLAVRATDAVGLSGAALVQVQRDTTPPRVTISSPEPAARISAPRQEPLTVTAIGNLYDNCESTDGNGCEVTVNGVTATVTGNSWMALHVPLAEGMTTLTVLARDRTGNTATAVRQVEGLRSAKRLIVVGGNGQDGEVGTRLENELVIQALDHADNPVPDVPVTFRVVRGNGILGNSERLERITTDETGKASVNLTLGTGADVASDRVEASAEGFLDTGFCASARVSATAERRLTAVGGIVQRGAAQSLAPRPLTVLLTDASGNAVGGEEIIFEVGPGGGRVNGDTTATVTTGPDGRASALFILGPLLGTNAQKVEARAKSNVEARAKSNVEARAKSNVDSVAFLASAVEAGAPEETSVSGLVLTNENEPIPDVEVFLEGETTPAVTDAHGYFVLHGVEPGHVHLRVVGHTAGPYPTLEQELDLISGVDNRPERPVYLPLLDADGKGTASPDADVVISRDDTPGLRLTIRAGSATFADGSKSGLVQVIRVNRDKIPMPPSDGTSPRMPLSIQPPDVRFDPPALLRLPNVENRAPGEVVSLSSFDHDVGEFVLVGELQVSEDGAFLESAPGQGIVKGGWHYAPPTPPSGRTNLMGADAYLVRCDNADTCYKYSFDVHPILGEICASTEIVIGQCDVATDCTVVDGKCACTNENCVACEVKGGACECRLPIATPDFQCLNPADPYPCELFKRPELWTMEGAFDPSMALLSDPPFDPRNDDAYKIPASSCQRLYEPSSPFTLLADGFCRIAEGDAIPICCPDEHWATVDDVCCIKPINPDGTCPK